MPEQQWNKRKRTYLKTEMKMGGRIKKATQSRSGMIEAKELQKVN